MISEENIECQRESLYKSYNEEIKPLVAEIEARFEEFPEPLLTEMFFFNDYMAKGYIKLISHDELIKSMQSAEDHLTQLKLYLYLYLNSALVETIKLFEQQTRNVDLNVVNDGEFLQKYTQMKKQAEDKLRFAREKEGTVSVSQSLLLYKKSYIAYCELEEYMNNKNCEVNLAISMYYRLSKKSRLLIWLLPIIISAVISICYPEKVLPFFLSIFQN